MTTGDAPSMADYGGRFLVGIDTGGALTELVAFDTEVFDCNRAIRCD